MKILSPVKITVEIELDTDALSSARERAQLEETTLEYQLLLEAQNALTIIHSPPPVIDWDNSFVTELKDGSHIYFVGVLLDQTDAIPEVGAI